MHLQPQGSKSFPYLYNMFQTALNNVCVKFHWKIYYMKSVTTVIVLKVCTSKEIKKIVQKQIILSWILISDYIKGATLNQEQNSLLFTDFSYHILFCPDQNFTDLFPHLAVEKKKFYI